MSEVEKQREIEDKNYHYRIKLEQLQDDQLEIRKERARIEFLQEEFFDLQQKEQALYNTVIANSEPDERAFYEVRGDESLHLAKKAQREFDEELTLLQKEERLLFEKEEKVRTEQQTFLKMNGKGKTDGT